MRTAGEIGREAECAWRLKKKKGGMIKDKKVKKELGQEGKTKIRNYKVNGLSRQSFKNK